MELAELKGEQGYYFNWNGDIWRGLAKVEPGQRYTMFVEDFMRSESGQKSKSLMPVEAEVLAVYPFHAVFMVGCKRNGNRYREAFCYPDIFRMKQNGRLKRKETKTE